MPAGLPTQGNRPVPGGNYRPGMQGGRALNLILPFLTRQPCALNELIFEN